MKTAIEIKGHSRTSTLWKKSVNLWNKSLHADYGTLLELPKHLKQTSCS